MKEEDRERESSSVSDMACRESGEVEKRWISGKSLKPWIDRTRSVGVE